MRCKRSWRMHRLPPIGVIRCKTSQKPEKLGRIQVSRTLLALRTSLSRSRNRNQQRLKPCQRPFPRPPPSPRLLPSGPTREEGTATNPGRPTCPSRSPRFGSGCLATRNPRQPSPANPGRNALQKARASSLSGTNPNRSPARRIGRYPVALASQNRPRRAAKDFPKPTWLTKMMKNHLTQPPFLARIIRATGAGFKGWVNTFDRTPGPPPSGARAAPDAGPTR